MSADITIWSVHREEVPGGLRFALFFDARPVTVAEVLGALRADAAFRAWFNALLADAPFTSFRFETPGVTAATLTRAFEFVVRDAPLLAARRPDPEAFADHFRAAPGAEAVAFPNLSGDAVLIVPTPRTDAKVYTHLAAFVRGAPESQRDALWQLVGEALGRRVGDEPVWFSTAGAGVSWLHVRLDDRPKYYGHAPYRAKPG